MSEWLETIQRFLGVTIAGAGLFRLPFEVSVWPSLVLVPAGLLFGGAYRDKNTAYWLVSVALMTSGMLGLFGWFEEDFIWRHLFRAEPFGRVLLVIYTLAGLAILLLKVRPRRQVDADA